MTSFKIEISIKTRSGPEVIGQFILGTNAVRARQIFSSLKGRADVNEDDILCMDLIELTNGLPLNLQVLKCTLDDIAENCRIISKEVFKIFNLAGK